MTVWITGIPASGKTTLGDALARLLRDAGVPVLRIDGDAIRSGLCADLDLSPAGRAENIRRAGETALLAAASGIVAVATLVSPMRADRDAVRARHKALGTPFTEVWLDTPLALCEARDPKGLYARARKGEIRGLTGFDAPYEPPSAPALRLAPDDPERMARRVLDILQGAAA